MHPSPLYRSLVLAAIALTFGVVALGAWVRLSDAGLGCPDWPGCYGHLIGVPTSPHEQAAAAQAYPARPLETGKAWKEMVHRYAAGLLGLLIFAITLLAWRRRIAPVATGVLAAVVVLQALLGMWTVTLLLKPVIVTAHLLGGMTTLALLVGLAIPGRDHRPAPPRSAALRLGALLALGVIVAQIALGGWVSSNYAALACPDFPTCHGAWLPGNMDFAHAYTLVRELGQTRGGELLSQDALTAIHWTHRVGALIVTIVVAALAALLLRHPAWRGQGMLLLALLATQVALGIANVMLALPLPLAVAHNLAAACLLTAVLAVHLRLQKR